MRESIALSVVVPCYNEEQVLPDLVRRLAEVCSGVGEVYEIVLVNDGSSDQTWQVMNGLAQAQSNLVLVNLSRNHGHQLALSAGLCVAIGERVLTIDADLQDPPELLPEMMAVMDRGADVVYAQRRRRPGDGMLKRIASTMFYRGLRIMTDIDVPQDTGDFRLMNRRVVDVLNAMPERRRFLRGMTSWIGFRQEPVFYDRDARAAGKSKYPFFKLLRLALDGVTSLSFKPLALAMYLGLGGVAIGLVLFGYVVVSLIIRSGETPTGWASLMAALIMFASLQLIVLGIIGEYLSQIHEQTKGRPIFVIDQVVRGREVTADRGSPSRRTQPRDHAHESPYPTAHD